MWHYFVFKTMKAQPCLSNKQTSGCPYFLGHPSKIFLIQHMKKKNQLHQYQNNELHFSPQTIEHTKDHTIWF